MKVKKQIKEDKQGGVYMVKGWPTPSLEQDKDYQIRKKKVEIFYRSINDNPVKQEDDNKGLTKEDKLFLKYLKYESEER